MPRLNAQQVMLYVDHDLLAQVEDWRRQQPTIPSRTAAFHHFIKRGLEADRKNQKTKAQKELTTDNDFI
jgi:hypothetical protein